MAFGAVAGLDGESFKTWDFCSAAQSTHDKFLEDTLQPPPYRPSSLKKSIIATKFLYGQVANKPDDFAPADLSMAAKKLAFNKYVCNTRFDVDSQVMQQAVDLVIVHYRKAAGSQLLDRESIISRFDPSKSSGITYRPFKKKGEVIKYPEAVDHLEQSSHQLLYEGCLTYCEMLVKDELRDVERVAAKKTRLFISGDLVGAWSGLLLCGDQNERLAKCWRDHSSVVGLNPFYDTDFIAKSHLAMEKSGMETFAGDISGWDYHVDVMFFVCLAYIRFNLMSYDLRTPEVFTAMVNYYRHVAYSPVSTPFGVVSFAGKQKSGFGNTIDDNCFINAIIFFYMILLRHRNITYSQICENFGAHFCGDDNLWSTFTDFLPHAYVEKIFQDSFGMIITIEPHRSILDGVTFCSSAFGYSLSLRRFVRVPNVDKIRAGACYYVKSGSHPNKILNLAVLAYPNRELHLQLKALWYVLTSDPFPLTDMDIRRIYTHEH
jgi:hypothetical protein